jgi:hypothetical protein
MSNPTAVSNSVIKRVWPELRIKANIQGPTFKAQEACRKCFRGRIFRKGLGLHKTILRSSSLERATAGPILRGNFDYVNACISSNPHVGR